MKLSESIQEMLQRFGNVHPNLSSLMHTSIIRLLNSEMIINDPKFTSYKPEKELPSRLQTVPSDIEMEIDTVISKIRNSGLKNDFHDLIALFGKLLMRQMGNQNQIDLVNQWANNGLSGTYLMTDNGGPSLSQWNTICTIDGDSLTLSIDKIWGIEAHQLGFAIVVTTAKNKPYPLVLLLPPDVCSQLSKSVAGKPFLENELTLGNVSGEATLSADFLFKASPAANSRYLCSVRPRFVRALLSQLQWLITQQRLTANKMTQTLIDNLDSLSQGYIARQHMLRPDVEIAMALKFLCNELLLSLVQDGLFSLNSDARDMLAFSKMEGSSYRCLYEIYLRRRKLS